MATGVHDCRRRTLVGDTVQTRAGIESAARATWRRDDSRQRRHALHRPEKPCDCRSSGSAAAPEQECEGRRFLRIAVLHEPAGIRRMGHRREAAGDTIAATGTGDREAVGAEEESFGKIGSVEVSELIVEALL